MTPTLLVLGSKPAPALPPRSGISDLACANASGRSARIEGLPDPTFTAMTAVLTSGNASDEHSFRQLDGLATGTLYHLGRPRAEQGSPLERLINRWKLRRLMPGRARRRLDGIGYRYDHFVARKASELHALILELCGHDIEIEVLIQEKQPSTGLMALAIGIELGRWQRFVLAGFDFTLAHAYGRNPLIAQRGSTASMHAVTDIQVLRCLARRRADILTTEIMVHERTGMPWLEGDRP